MKKPTEIAKKFGYEGRIQTIGDGHINNTYLVIPLEGHKLILQKINRQVFRKPEELMANLVKILDHLARNKYPYKPLRIIHTTSGDPYWSDPSGFWRAFEYIDDCSTLTHTNNTRIAWMTAEAYSVFINTLAGLSPSVIRKTIPDFNNPGKRFEEFIDSVNEAVTDRADYAGSLIEQAMDFSDITRQYAEITADLPLRVTHNDTKLSNILFGKKLDRVVAIVDFDTIMPGYVMNDFGDLARSICNTGREDEADISKVSFSTSLFKAISEGYVRTLKDTLTPKENENLLFGVRIMIYIQFIRFLSDYLIGDRYYRIAYPEQNLNRANVHLKLLLDFQEKEEMLMEIISEV